MTASRETLTELVSRNSTRQVILRFGLVRGVHMTSPHLACSMKRKPVCTLRAVEMADVAALAPGT